MGRPIAIAAAVIGILTEWVIVLVVLRLLGERDPVPPEFVKELARNAEAKQFYATLVKTNLFSIAYRLQTAKRPETKNKRIKLIIEMLARGEKFH